MKKSLYYPLILYLSIIITCCSFSDTFCADLDMFVHRPLKAKTIKLVSYKQIKGKQIWQKAHKKRILGATWIFEPDGSFIFNMPDVRTDLYPVHGTYEAIDTTIEFKGSSSVKIGKTGQAKVEISGHLYDQINEKVITMIISSFSSSVAKINNQKFGYHNLSIYKFTVLAE